MKNLLLLSLSGSRSYGIDTDASDYDYRGIFILPKMALLSCSQECTSYTGMPESWKDDGTLANYKPGCVVSQINELPGSWKDGDEIRQYGKDSVAFELRKWFKLAGAGNPNVIEPLFVKKEHIIVTSKWGNALIDARDDFLSKSCAKKYIGYARNQLSRIKNHQLMVEAEKSGGEIKRPERNLFGLESKAMYSKDVLSALINAPGGTLRPEVKEYIEKEREYSKAYNQWLAWTSWKKNRNSARASDELKFGFDLKNATHTMRLLLQCHQILQEGTLNVWSKDRAYLRSIRNGEVTYTEILLAADTKIKQIEEVESKSLLREMPDWEKLNQLCAELADDFYKTIEGEKHVRL
jgi:predicted nucleotidyltransferase